HGCSRHGYRMRADGGLRTDFLGDRKGALEKLMQQSTQRASLLGRAHCVFHLTKNLRLAQHHGVQPAGHPKGMSDGVVLLVLIQMWIEAARFKSIEVGEPG